MFNFSFSYFYKENYIHHLSAANLMNSEPYLLFKEKCIDEFYDLLEEFDKLYDFDKHTAWHYDHRLGIFTLKFEDHNIYFKYVDVGSYSHNTNTWMWSWYNEHTPEKVKIEMERIPQFGQEQEYESLTTGLIEAEKEIGWEMTAIAHRFIHGIGAYSVSIDHLDIYFLFTHEIDESTYAKIKKKSVHCGEHGSRRRAFVCQHLKLNVKTGFEESFPTYPDMEFEDEDDDLQAWCDECEKIRVQYDGWNEESEKFANIKVICEKCYFEIKEFNLGYKEG